MARYPSRSAASRHASAAHDPVRGVRAAHTGCRGRRPKAQRRLHGPAVVDAMQDARRERIPGTGRAPDLRARHAHGALAPRPAAWRCRHRPAGNMHHRQPVDAPLDEAERHGLEPRPVDRPVRIARRHVDGRQGPRLELVDDDAVEVREAGAHDLAVALGRERGHLEVRVDACGSGLAQQGAPAVAAVRDGRVHAREDAGRAGVEDPGAGSDRPLRRPPRAGRRRPSGGRTSAARRHVPTITSVNAVTPSGTVRTADASMPRRAHASRTYAPFGSSPTTPSSATGYVAPSSRRSDAMFSAAPPVLRVSAPISASPSRGG